MFNVRSMISLLQLLISLADIIRLLSTLRRMRRNRLREQNQRLLRHVTNNGSFEYDLQIMTDREFKRYIRMSRQTFDKLCIFVNGIERMNNYMRTSRISFEKIMHMTCYYMGSKDTTFAISQKFGVSEETFLRSTTNVLQAIVDRIQDLIQWPERNQYRRIADKFNEIGKEYFPNVIGALDGCHLEIELNQEKIDEPSYQNYHQYYSIILMAIATYDLSFIQIHVGWPGRANDSLVWRNTDTWYNLDNYLADGRRTLIQSYSIVADAAFPCRKHLMSSYKSPAGQDLDMIRKNFNRCLASKRQNVERSFSLLKRKFPRIVKLNQKSTQKKILVAMAACALHNICIKDKDDFDNFLDIASTQQRTLWPELPKLTEEGDKTIGELKRDLLARSFVTQ